MKLSMLAIVNRAATVLARIDDAIAEAENGRITISLGSTTQDEAMCMAAKAAILGELRARRCSIIRDLESYGVDVNSGHQVLRDRPSFDLRNIT